MHKMLTIAGLTFKEALRKKILVAALILTLLFLALYGTGLHFLNNDMERIEKSCQVRENGSELTTPQRDLMTEGPKRMLLILGIYFSSSIVALLAIFSSVGAVSSEIENGMLHAILAKPIRRRDIILGKYIGYALMLSFYAVLLFGSVLAFNHYFTGIKLGSGIPMAIGLFIM